MRFWILRIWKGEYEPTHDQEILGRDLVLSNIGNPRMGETSQSDPRCYQSTWFFQTLSQYTVFFPVIATTSNPFPTQTDLAHHSKWWKVKKVHPYNRGFLSDFSQNPSWLVVGNMNFMIFHSVGNGIIIPTDVRTHIFQRGRRTNHQAASIWGILHASSFGGCTSQRCVLQVARSLQRLGRRLDGGQLGAVGGAGAMVEMDLVDRMVLLKPVDWEVSDENMEQLGTETTWNWVDGQVFHHWILKRCGFRRSSQLSPPPGSVVTLPRLQVVDFLRDSGSSMPILEDKEFGQGSMIKSHAQSSFTPVVKSCKISNFWVVNLQFSDNWQIHLELWQKSTSSTKSNFQREHKTHGVKKVAAETEVCYVLKSGHLSHLSRILTSWQLTSNLDLNHPKLAHRVKTLGRSTLRGLLHRLDVPSSGLLLMAIDLAEGPFMRNSLAFSDSEY